MSNSTATVNQLLADTANRLVKAKHGEKIAIYEELANKLGKSTRTVINLVKAFTGRVNRKKRSDAGQITLSLREAEYISALLMQNLRNNQKKQLSSIKLAIERLVANGLITAGRVNEDTGEFKPLSISAISKALYAYDLHPKQLTQPAPAIRLASKHPNHVWQIDASIGTQYYLDTKGIEVMDPAVYYDGKPENLKKIEDKRLQRYAITDHCSGTIYAEYALGAETAESLCHCFLNAIQQRSNLPFHGVPLMVMVDPGTAMKSHMFRNLCHALGIELIINRVKNARAKGSVEKAHDIIECNFESGLKLEPATNLETLNNKLHRWMHNFNTFATHTRTDKSRYSVWQTIKTEQLRLPPPMELCRELLVIAPEKRVVAVDLTISYKGNKYDVSTVPDVLVGEKIVVTRNPWRDEDSAQIVLTNEQGREYFHIVERLTVDEYGFYSHAAVIGDNYKKHAETPAQKNLKQVEQLALGTATETETIAAKKARKLPFDGVVDPFKHITDAVLPSYLPKQGIELETKVALPVVEEKKLSPTQLAKQLKELLPAWSSEHMKWLRANHPDGAPESAISSIAEIITQQVTKHPQLSVVGG